METQPEAMESAAVELVVTAPNFHSLTELRMWHWDKFKLYRGHENDARRRNCEPSVEQWRQLAHLHLSAVQVLNDSLPLTYAEQDCQARDAKLAAVRQLVQDAATPPAQ